MEILRDKTVVIDTSIYMYKYHAQNALIENFYLLLSIFHKYNITPIFIFDGKPPAEKYELLKQRKADKCEAENRFTELQLQLETENDVTIRNNLTSEMNSLKRQFIRVSQYDNKVVKRLIESYGAMYYEANGEADRVCAYMVTSGKAWACLSDDMDMFVYGCNRVLRHLSVINETVLLYNMDNILTDLKISMTEFRQIAVVSGTDYNINEETNLIETLRETTTIETIENEKIDATIEDGITTDLSLRSASETSKENESKITPVLDEMKIDEVDIDKVRVTKNTSNMIGLYIYVYIYIL